MEITTANGFNCTIDEGALDDPDLFESLVRLQKGNYDELIDAVNGILGPKGWEQLKGFTKKKDGKATVSGMVSEFYMVLTEAGRSKKN